MSDPSQSENPYSAAPKGPAKPDKPRSGRHVRSAAKILAKEAKTILGKHASRIAEAQAAAMRESLAELNRLREENDTANPDWLGSLEAEAERLDDLLHQHASFARKSALRETLENIGIAVLVALGLRSCVYEPFKIPSESMLPTLRIGDHIFVKKFSYGVQIPFTSTVVASFLGDIERGDVIVFRYPLDPADDYIKRVIGIPGDQVRVMGRVVSLKRANDEEFEVLQRTPLEKECINDATGRAHAGCQLFEETIGDKTYVVRYRTMMSERNDFLPKAKTFTVPEGHVLVMGDNRNESSDSTQWTVEVAAVDAAAVISDKDLRDLTDEKLFTQTRPKMDAMADPSHDHVVWLATHRSRAHDISLSVWRSPQLGAEATWSALTARVDGAEDTTVAALVDGKPVPTGDALTNALTVGASIDRLVVGRTEDGWSAVAFLEEDDAVLLLECGRRVCKNSGRLAMRLTDAVEAFRTSPEKATRELLARPRGVEYGNRWTGRSDVRDHYYERQLQRSDAQGARGHLRLRVFRKPKQSLDVLQDAALRAVGTSAAEAPLAPELGERAWIVTGEDAFTLVATDDVRDMVVVLDCGKALCRSIESAQALGKVVLDRVPKASSDRRQLRKMLQTQDVSAMAGGDVKDLKVLQPPRNPFDRTRLEATVQGKDHALELEVWHEPAEGLAAKVAQIAGPLDLSSSDAVGQYGQAGEDDEAFHHVFAIPGSDSVVRVRCRKGLCEEADVALAIARRAADEAQDPDNFIDPNARRPQPFVPMGNVKGRADVIWFPLERFWLKVR
ncbi:MAG: signal peptidase I [Nannocystaceae bacterium]|nr:signal peptidase I [Nannocystaceae bacterium]